MKFLKQSQHETFQSVSTLFRLPSEKFVQSIVIIKQSFFKWCLGPGHSDQTPVFGLLLNLNSKRSPFHSENASKIRLSRLTLTYVKNVSIRGNLRHMCFDFCFDLMKLGFIFNRIPTSLGMPLTSYTNLNPSIKTTSRLGFGGGYCYGKTIH